MIHLAAERRAASSTQNQAFNAILFFYRHVLQKEIDNIEGTICVHAKKLLPVVLIRDEVTPIFRHLKGVYNLMARLIYGCGLRIQECYNLRIKDIDFK